MSAQLPVAVVVKWDASGVAAGAAQTASGLSTINAEAKGAATSLGAYNAANDQAVATAKRATDALLGQTAAEKNLQAAINQRLGISQNTGQVGSPFSQNAFRAADIEAYGKSLDDLRAKYNPLFAAERQHLQTLQAINEAASVGAIDDAERAAAIATATGAYERQVAFIRRVTGAVNEQTGAFALNRAGMMELRASGINAFQALAAGMSASQVIMMERSQVIGAVIQGTEGGLATLLKSVAGGATSIGGTLLGALATPEGAIVGSLAAAATAVLTYTSYVRSGIPSADEVLKEHKAFIDEITKAYPQAAAAAKKYEDQAKAIPSSVASAHSQNDIADQQKLLKSYHDQITSLLAFTHAGGLGEQFNLGQYGEAGVKAFKELDDEWQKGTITAQELLEKVGNIEIDPSLNPAVHRLAQELELSAKNAASLEASVKGTTAANTILNVLGGRPDFGESKVFPVAGASAGFLAQITGKAVQDAQLSPYEQALQQQISDLQDKLLKAGLSASDADLRASAARIVGTSYLQQPSSYSFSAAQAPEQYRQALLQTFNPNLIASIIGSAEDKNWDPRAYNSTYGAAGLGQFIPGTARMLGINPYDPNQAIEGMNTYLQQLIKQNGGNEYAAVAQYGGASKSDVSRILAGQAPLNPDVQKYLDEIFNPGQGVTQQLGTIKQWNASIDAATGSLKIQQGVYGQSFQAMDQASIKQQLLAQYIASGGKASDTAAKSIDGVAAALATLDQKARAVQFLNDLQFQRDQLGRSQDEQQVYSDLRQRQIDINTPAGQAAAAADRTTIALSNMKSVASDAFGTLVQDLQNGASGWKTFSDFAVTALNDIEKKLEDRLISSLFGGGTGSGGGFFDWLFGGSSAGSFPSAPVGPVASDMSLADWGFAVGGFTGSGGKFQPKGIVHAGEFVFDAASTSAIGVDNLYRLQAAGRRGFAEGGYSMPWARSSGSGAGGSSDGPSVAIYDQRGSDAPPIEQRETMDASGNKRIEFFVRDIARDEVTRPSAKTNRQLRGTYGLTQQVITR